VSHPVRLGAVSYLNVRPLVHGLGSDPRVSLRFDIPSDCARLLAEGAIDLGMVPSITYADRPGDRIVPGVCIGSDGPVASVALFSRKPVRDIRSIALDASSRTSAMLVRILCARVFHVDATFVTRPPDLGSMLAAADAALLIGDPALFLDPRAFGAEKIDLGQAWTDMTGLPFVWAFWSGRAEAADAHVVLRLQMAAAEGQGHIDAIAADYCAATPAEIPLATAYLRENLTFHLTWRAEAGLARYYHEAHELGFTSAVPTVTFFPSSS
jgi:chorismate dehydratase